MDAPWRVRLCRAAMETRTLVLLLAINMICSGGLYNQIVRKKPCGSGLGLWSAAAILFGVAYPMRMIEGLREPTLASPSLDVLMVTAAAMFLAGLRQFLGRRSVDWNVVAIEGTGSMYGTPRAGAYNAYASIAVILQTMNFLWMVFLRLQTRLAELASRDALTRLHNRNGLDEQLRRHFALRETQPVTLLQLDVDHFKRINDEHGHAVGDVVLQAVAGALRIDMPNAASQNVGCTVSIGVSREFASLDRWGMAWREADNALYSAKQGGRNRVAMYAPT
jgi:GGDEF domain-containing protein